MTYVLNFPNGNVQTYPDHNTMQNAVRAMGGTATQVGTTKDSHLYAFTPKK